ncbi:MAG: 1-acyl-sn-glycerol-3-phosphate acyltransferase [Bacteroidia bacterium]|nr:1-acyl-sn-glycerol-3-phosphate acyltransferase [Bacteroidia bacterium]
MTRIIKYLVNPVLISGLVITAVFFCMIFSQLEILFDVGIFVFISSLVVFGILFLFFGRIELCIIVFLPVVLNLIFLSGIIEIAGLKPTFNNKLILLFIFGLSIIYSVSITYSMIYEYKYGTKIFSYNRTSIIISGAIIVLCTGALMIAVNPVLWQVAVLSATGIILSILFTNILPPVAFKSLIGKRGKYRQFPVTLFGFIYAFFCYSYFFLGGFCCISLGITIIRIIPSQKFRSMVLHILIYFVCRSTMYIMFLAKKRIINREYINFSRPAIYICNHQSLIDIPLSLMFTPKMIVLTTDWVQNNVITGIIARMADFYPISFGLAQLEKKLAKKIKDGYSIFVFPEGTRSRDCKLKRFHKGGFYLAEKFKLDIAPIVIHGTGHYVSKGHLLGRRSTITIKFLERIAPENKLFGENYSERTKEIAKYFRNESEKIMPYYHLAKYHKDRLVKNYIYKGTVLEWKLKKKLRNENNFEAINSLIPHKGIITDIGCGYGFICYMLWFVSNDRKITGIDNDEEKIQIAENCPAKNQNIEFICSNLNNLNLKSSDVFILNDILLNLPETDKKFILSKCISNLNPEGKLIIRNGNDNYIPKKIEFSKNFIRNGETGKGGKGEKFTYSLHQMLNQIALTHGLTLETICVSEYSSNEIYILKK